MAQVCFECYSRNCSEKFMQNRDDDVSRPNDVSVFFVASLRFGAPEKIAKAAGSKGRK